MNVVRIMGGVGNQLFQYAFGKAMLHNGIEVIYDTSWYVETARKVQYPRPFALDKFNTNLRVGSFIGGQPTVHEYMKTRVLGYTPSLLGLHNHNFEGYWQFLPYFKHLLPTLKEEIQVRSEFYTEEFLKWVDLILDTSNSVSMHVRRGDYLTHKGTFRNLPAKYYFNCLREVEKGDVFIFSDDISWCRETFKQEYFKRKLYFVDMVDYLSFELMRYCKTNITTNSTFSIWAAYLNDHTDKKVLRPKCYLGGDTTDDHQELHYPREWIIMEDYVNN